MRTQDSTDMCVSPSGFSFLTDHESQVAVARHLGLQTLKLSSSPLLPFNTSHYAFELEYYLDRYACIAAFSHYMLLILFV